MQAIRRLVGMVLLLAPLATGTAAAQWWTAISYQPGVPMSNTKDFTDSFGWRGVGLDFKKQVKPAVAVGFSFGWQVFDHQTDDVVSAFGIDISGDQFRYVNSFPLLANVSYFFGREGGPRPYVSANVGAYVMEHRLEIGLYAIEETNLHFGFAPEAGLARPVQPNLAAVLSGRYNYALAAGNVDEQAYLGIGLGLAWTHGY